MRTSPGRRPVKAASAKIVCHSSEASARIERICSPVKNLPGFDGFEHGTTRSVFPAVPFLSGTRYSIPQVGGLHQLVIATRHGDPSVAQQPLLESSTIQVHGSFGSSVSLEIALRQLKKEGGGTPFSKFPDRVGRRRRSRGSYFAGTERSSRRVPVLAKRGQLKGKVENGVYQI